jgi:hypothetical protein
VIREKLRNSLYKTESEIIRDLGFVFVNFAHTTYDPDVEAMEILAVQLAGSEKWCRIHGRWQLKWQLARTAAQHHAVKGDSLTSSSALHTASSGSQAKMPLASSSSSSSSSGVPAMSNAGLFSTSPSSSSSAPMVPLPRAQEEKPVEKHVVVVVDDDEEEAAGATVAAGAVVRDEEKKVAAAAADRVEKEELAAEEERGGQPQEEPHEDGPRDEAEEPAPQEEARDEEPTKSDMSAAARTTAAKAPQVDRAKMRQIPMGDGPLPISANAEVRVCHALSFVFCASLDLLTSLPRWSASGPFGRRKQPHKCASTL